MIANIDGLIIPRSDTSVSGFVYNKQVGWYEGGSSKTSFTKKPQAYGSFGVGNIEYDELVVSFEGVYVGRNSIQTAQARGLLAGKKNRGRSIRIQFTDAFGTSFRDGYVSNVSMPHNGDQLNFEWGIDIVCPDPRRYISNPSVSTGLPVTTGGQSWPQQWPYSYGSGGNSGRVSVSNIGTTDAPLAFQVTGGFDTGFVITDVTTGKFLQILRQVPVGSTIYLNSKNGSASIDRQSSVGPSVSGSWLTLPPGETHQLQLSSIGTSSGTPIMTVQSFSALE